MREHLGRPAPPNSLIDRKNETKYLTSRMKSAEVNYNIAVLGHRRIGKTSILFKVEEELSKEDIVVVYFDVKKNMNEPKIFLKQLQKHIFDAYIKKLSNLAKIRADSDKIMSIFSDIKKSIMSKKIKGVGISFTPDGKFTPHITLDESMEGYSDLFYSVFNTATVFSEKSKIKFVLILDEFQDMIKLRNYKGLKNIFDMFRSVVQERGDNVSFIISGSHVHMLSQLLGKGESAMFIHFLTQSIGELDEKSSIQLFNSSLKSRKKTVNSKIAKEAYGTVGGHPLYLTTLAESWDGKQKIPELLESQLIKPTSPLAIYCEYMMLDDFDSNMQRPLSRAILRALSESEKGLSYSKIAEKLECPMSRLPKYVKPLVEADLVVRDESGFKIRDAVLRRYLSIEASGLL